MEGIYQPKGEDNVYEAPRLASETVLGWKFSPDHVNPKWCRGKRPPRAYGWVTPDGRSLERGKELVWNPCNHVHLFAKEHGFNDEWELYNRLKKTGETLGSKLPMESRTSLWDHLES